MTQAQQLAAQIEKTFGALAGAVSAAGQAMHGEIRKFAALRLPPVPDVMRRRP